MPRRDFILRNGQATSKTPKPERRVRLPLPQPRIRSAG